MLRRAGVRSRITGLPEEIATAEALVLPGVGHFDEGMAQLESRGLLPVLHHKVKVEQTPVLGICLGAQLLARHSAEGDRKGLGWVAADVQRFDFSGAQPLPVPHMGWNEIEPVDAEMFAGYVAGDTRFYFVHSYHFVCDSEASVAAWCTYGHRFAAAVRERHVWGVQFHPEKSHRFGLKLMERWVAFAQGARRAA